MRAVVAFLNWARVQRNPLSPFSEVIDGTRFRPLDLLLEPLPLTPLEQEELGRGGFGLQAAEPRLPFWVLRSLSVARSSLGRSNPRAWRHVLNLVAVSAEYGDQDIVEMLDEIDPVAQQVWAE